MGEKVIEIQRGAISRDLADPFDEFWRAYPRRLAKGDARKAWQQTARIRPPLETIVAAIAAQKQSDQWKRDGGQFIPYPATWLRAERWDDEVIVETEPDKAWHESASGIEAKASELGIRKQDFPTFPAFKAAVVKAATKAG